MEGQQQETEKLITSSMIAFINQHIQSSHLSTLDEIVLSYVVTVFESLATESLKNLHESFDLEEFCEMLTAYVPEFSCIPQSVVSEWIFELVTSLKKSSDEKNKPQQYDKVFSTLLEEIDRSDPTPRSKRSSESSSECSFNGGSKKSSSSRTPRVSETSDTETDVADIIQRLQLEEKMQTLIEMFPSLDKAEAKNFVCMSNGDLERAVQITLLALEDGSYPLQSPNGTSKPRNGKARTDVDEKVLKKQIVERYGYIDQAEDTKEFRPAPLKFEKPKLIRYREGQVVSTKGERYTEVRVRDGEELPKPYLAKPNKQN